MSFCSSGLKAIIFFKIIVLLLMFWLLLRAVNPSAGGKNILALFISFTFFIFIFIERTEPRPEIFSYLFLAFYIFAIFQSKYRHKNSFLLVLPLIQLLWVNSHIYFIIGPVIYFLFFLDRLINKPPEFSYKKLILIGLLIGLANFLNPNGWQGAVYPLTILNSYGYDIVENKSIFFLAKYFKSWALSDKFFLASLFAGFCLFIANIRRFKTYIFEFLLFVFLAILALKMKRNVQLYAIGMFPVLANQLDLLLARLTSERLRSEAKPILRAASSKKVISLAKQTSVVILLVLVYLAVSNKFYNYIDSSKRFGLGIPQSTQAATDFIKENNISGNVFNNFDIGSYLIWQLYPEQKVFIDGRPEAYPAEFFSNVYKPMQSKPEVWEKLSREYGINYVFFSHTDITPWAGDFINNLKKNKEWPIVFLNDSIIIFVNRSKAENPAIISQYELTPEKFKKSLPEMLVSFDKNQDTPFRALGNILYRLGWYENSAFVYEALIQSQKDSPYGYQGAGYAYSAVNNIESQKMAAQRIEKALEFGLENGSNFFVLGVAYANLGDFEKAKQALRKSLTFESNNTQAIKILQYLETGK